MSADLRLPRVNPRLFPIPQNQNPRTPRKRADQGTRRGIRCFANSMELKNPESKEFTEPEYLDYQSRSLKLDISIIEKELKPLKEQYAVLKLQEDVFSPDQPHRSAKSPGDTSPSTWGGETPSRTDLSSMVRQSQMELKNAQTQLAQIRRIYSEANRIRLMDEIQQHQDWIEQYSSVVDSQKSRIAQLSKDLESLTTSEDAAIIIDQKQTIQALKEQLDSLYCVEDEFIKRNDEMLDHAPLVVQMSAKVEQMNKKLSSLQYNKSSKIVELARKRKYYEQRKTALQDLIEDAITKRRRREDHLKLLEEMKIRRVSSKSNANQNEYMFEEEEEESYSYDTN